MVLINLPIGIIAVLGCVAYLRKSTIRIRRFDFFGFATLSLGLGAFQSILDRDGEVDWFAAQEILIYTAWAVTGFCVFVIDISTAPTPFFGARDVPRQQLPDGADLHLHHRHQPFSARLPSRLRCRLSAVIRGEGQIASPSQRRGL